MSAGLFELRKDAITGWWVRWLSMSCASSPAVS